jgi:chromosome segregation ATPase
MAVTYMDLAAKTNAQSTRTADMERQRIRLLEAMLEDKTQRLRQLSDQLEVKTAQFEELRARYDEAVVLAVESLSQDSNATTAPSDRTGKATSDKKADPALLEAELSVAREVHESLVSDVTVLQEELSRAQRELDQLKVAQDQETMERLREATVLENAAASVLLSVGREAVPALRDALNHPSPAVRQWAATVLGGIGPEADDALAALTEALSDADPNVRSAVQSALEAIER